MHGLATNFILFSISVCICWCYASESQSPFQLPSGLRQNLSDLFCYFVFNFDWLSVYTGFFFFFERVSIYWCWCVVLHSLLLSVCLYLMANLLLPHPVHLNVWCLIHRIAWNMAIFALFLNFYFLKNMKSTDFGDIYIKLFKNKIKFSEKKTNQLYYIVNYFLISILT